MSKPQTEAGQALVDNAPDIMDLNDDILSRDGLRSWVHRIEAEAVADFVDTMPIELQETIIRDWLASGDAERRLATALHQWARRARTLEPNDEGIRAILAALRADDVRCSWLNDDDDQCRLPLNHDGGHHYDDDGPLPRLDRLDALEKALDGAVPFMAHSGGCERDTTCWCGYEAARDAILAALRADDE